MSLILNRPFYFRVGRLEVFAEGWKRLAGEPLIQSERTTTAISEEFQVWMPCLHLLVSISPVQRGEACV